MESYNHFVVMEQLGNPYSLLGRAVLAQMGLIPKLEDLDSCHVRRHWDIRCKNVRWSNGIWAPCSGAHCGADESMSLHFSISRT
jgi:hypothetical protein